MRPSEQFNLKNFSSFKDGRQYFIIRNPRPEQDAGERPPRTVVVLGSPRGGTTMAASVLRLLGEEFGDELDWVLEDVEIQECLDSVVKSFMWWKAVTVRRRFARIIRNRHRRWKRWAFKSPVLAPFALWLSGSIPNPYFLIPMRNSLESSFGLSDLNGKGWRTSVLQATFWQLSMAVFSLLTRRPVMLFSYDHVIREPERFVEVLADFLSIPLDDARKQAAVDCIDPHLGYHRAPGTRVYVEHLTHRGIDGWAVDGRQPERLVTLNVCAGDDVIAAVRADRRRLDVRNAGFHPTGLCGFTAVFDEALTKEALKTVRLVDSATGEFVLTP